ncbi:MAG: hypothetical protein KatS3mg065_0046 [Chloroflexota bacterium]|nr:MAG: hypothetical protein KatS3mg065_0046 [Chloroflexota bacterium]
MPDGTARSGRMYFIGVATGGSSIHRIFPRWATDPRPRRRARRSRHRPRRRAGAFRAVVEEIRSRPGGARGPRDDPQGLDRPHARISSTRSTLGELCRRGLLPREARRSPPRLGEGPDHLVAGLRRVAGADYFARHPRREVLCLGAGGSGTAFTLAAPPLEATAGRIVVTNRSPERLDVLREHPPPDRVTVPVEYRAVEDPRTPTPSSPPARRVRSSSTRRASARTGRARRSPMPPASPNERSSGTSTTGASFASSSKRAARRSARGLTVGRRLALLPAWLVGPHRRGLPARRRPRASRGACQRRGAPPWPFGSKPNPLDK